MYYSILKAIVEQLQNATSIDINTKDKTFKMSTIEVDKTISYSFNSYEEMKSFLIDFKKMAILKRKSSLSDIITRVQKSKFAGFISRLLLATIIILFWKDIVPFTFINTVLLLIGRSISKDILIILISVAKYIGRTDETKKMDEMTSYIDETMILIEKEKKRKETNQRRQKEQDEVIITVVQEEPVYYHQVGEMDNEHQRGQKKF